MIVIHHKKYSVLGFVFLFAITFLGHSLCQNMGQPIDDPLRVAKMIADRFIDETDFRFEPVPLQEANGLQIVDFRKNYPNTTNATAYALTYIEAAKDTIITFGVSYCQQISIWLNDRLVFEGALKQQYRFKEYTYDRFDFDDEFKARIEQGLNKMLVKVSSYGNDWIFFLRPVGKFGILDSSVEFTLQPFAPKIASSKWFCIGPFPHVPNAFPTEFPPEKSIENYYHYQDKFYSWSIPKKDVVLNLIINPSHSYTRESHADWHYAIGALLMTLLNLSDILNEPKYVEFVRTYHDFICENYPYLRHQYFDSHAIRQSYHRLIRKTMLDDSGAPALGLLELYRREQPAHYRPFIDTLANYISKGQIRLNDGTFCRDEPLPFTVWADDLFMSVPFMLRMAMISGNPAWYDDVALQMINFHHYLFDKKMGLYKHGWYSPTNEQAIAFWGRANGWIVWATAEALLFLPKDHPKYNAIKKINRRHIEGLVKYQGKNGLWHQLLDRSDSFEETSCTAMFVLGIARGIRYGWLDEKFRAAALKGWNGIQTKINPDGIVSGICQGTGIGDNFEFYYCRQTFDNDPRGLGAIIQAGIEIFKLK